MTKIITAAITATLFCGLTAVYGQEPHADSGAEAVEIEAAEPVLISTPETPTSVPAPAQPLSTPLPGKPAQSLSLQDALQRAIRDNPLVRIERINTGIAESILREAHSPYDPRLRASYSLGHSDSRKLAGSHDLSASVSKAWQTGTNIEAGMGASPYSSIRDPDKNYRNSLGLTITQALMQGLDREVNLVPLRKAEIDIDIRREELAAYAQRLLVDTERAYWDLLLSGEQMGIYKYSLELAQRLLYESEERLKIGGIAPIELVAIRAEVASRERQLFDAQTARRQKTLYIAYLMNAPEFLEADAALTDTAASLGGADPVADHIDAANTFRPDYKMAFMQAQKGELDLVQTENGLLPRLDFFVSLSALTPAASFPGALLPGVGGSMTGAVMAGLKLDYPLKNASAREKRRRTEYSVEQQKLSIMNYARLIEYEIRSAHLEVGRAARQVETAKTVSALQLQKLEAEQEKMNAGKSTGYAVLQVQRDLVSASLDEAQARTAYVNALISLYSRDGTFLRRRGVEF